MTRKHFALRISPDLYAALERWATDDLRSVNAQIEYLLVQSVKKAGRSKEKESPEGEERQSGTEN
ncbi:hypothetical protein FNU79_04455 [Deinococcus detaillensis]|uniref:Arc family DNA-binding protein n=1 Tax=Deinococcus detaillensis TaxID=2592048 RepID=A0A553V3S0_9DEIO|nr:hypothetical protein [Deinococcus detaillensis]TSA87148.1 hypothetical protein FNU79_04455 [Deinococcus detaillensis]